MHCWGGLAASRARAVGVLAVGVFDCVDPGYRMSVHAWTKIVGSAAPLAALPCGCSPHGSAAFCASCHQWALHSVSSCQRTQAAAQALSTLIRPVAERWTLRDFAVATGLQLQVEPHATNCQCAVMHISSSSTATFHGAVRQSDVDSANRSGSGTNGSSSSSTAVDQIGSQSPQRWLRRQRRWQRRRR